MRLHRIRIIQQGGGTTTLGLSIPNELQHWMNVLVTVNESGNCLILESGTTPQPLSNKELISYSIKTDFVKL